MKKLCLAFICKNNKDTIGEMIDSCLPYIDSIIALDTGSSDKTMGIITSYVGKVKKITLKERAFDNFQNSRNVLMRNVQRDARKNQYVLIMDTDETLVVEEPKEFLKFIDGMTSECYMVLTKDTAMSYRRDRILSNSLSYSWKGYAHEYVKPVDSPFKDVGNIPDYVYFKLRPKVGNAHIKRNLRLLMNEIRDKVATPRTYFYLGESNYDLGNYVDAKGWYEQRIEEQGWDQETYYTAFKAGMCYFYLEKYDAAIKYLSKAIGLRPQRNEAPFNLGKLYQGQDKHMLAAPLFRMCVNRQCSDILFVDEIIPKYLARFELAISEFYCGNALESLRQAKEVSTVRNVPKEILNQNLRNISTIRQHINRTAKDKILVISLPAAWDGLGDALFMSHIPKAAKEVGRYKYVYVSSIHYYKSGGTDRVVWENNPWVDGFINEFDTFVDKADKLHWALLGLPDTEIKDNYIKGNPIMHRILEIYGLHYDDYDGLPWMNDTAIYNLLKTKRGQELYKRYQYAIIFDGNWKAHCGLDKEQVVDYFAKHSGITVNYQFQKIPHKATAKDHPASVPKSIQLPEVDYVERLESLEEYIFVITICKKFYCLMSGGAVVCAAMRRPCIVIDSKKTSQAHRFDEYNLHKYLNKELPQKRTPIEKYLETIGIL